MASIATEGCVTGAALPPSRERTKKPISALPSIGAEVNCGGTAVDKFRNIPQETAVEAQALPDYVLAQ